MVSSSASTPPAAPARKTVAENVRETLENIVVAFILAFVFRAFIVEAFIIPTGSMAPTLYGEHLTNTCSTCGYQYAVGIVAEQAARRSLNQPLRLRCPNCDTLFDSFSPAQVAQPDSGDRIVVHKWPFDVAADWLGAKRWDVIVFKDPRDGTTNFIKRLVGLPGEVLEIVDGDVYTAPLKDLKPELLQAVDKLREDVYRYRLSAPGSRGELREPREEFQRRYAEINRQLLPLLRIQRKQPHLTRAQQSLWFNVYNQDLLPNYEPRASVKPEQRVRWAPAENAAQAWNTSEREIKFDSDGDEPLAMKFTGKPVDDFYAYNLDGAYYEQRRDRQMVGDLRLHFTWFPDSGNGGIRMSMNRDQDTFVAELNVDGSTSVRGVLPDSDVPGHKVLVGEKKLEAFAPGRAVEVEFCLLDYRVYLFVNGDQVIASTDSQYAPTTKKMARFIEMAQRLEDVAIEVSEIKPSEVEISAWNLHCRMRHVGLERDVYYRSQKQMQPDGVDEHNQTVLNPYYNWPGWGTAGFPIMLRAGRQKDGRTYSGEYFMCGDNSPASKDSRLWWEIGPHLRPLGSEYQVGTVPEDQLIGQAFFVYWPAGLRSTWMNAVGWIPNVGRMRWIR